MLKSFFPGILTAHKQTKLSKKKIHFSLKGIPVIDKFIGRNTEISILAQLMISSSTNTMFRKVSLLHGIGVGKSQLAIEFARKYQEYFSAIFLIAGSTKEKLKKSIAAIAQRLLQHQITEKARSLRQRF